MEKINNNKYGLLSYSTDNIGDDIQSIAASQFLPNINGLYDRDRLSLYKKKDHKVKIILNGWFMHKNKNDYNFPPAPFFDPLFVAFHCDNENLLSDEVVKYLKSHGPVGCRDYQTLELMKKRGIEAYFSACLTLTIKKPKVFQSNEVIFVDAFGHDGNYVYPMPLDKNFPKENWKNIQRKVGKNCRYLSHSFSKSFANPQMRLELAKEFINLYAKAKFVITSRIHVALPCLAMGVPVLFLTNKQIKNDPRLNGITEFFNCMVFEDFIENFEKINFENPSKNPDKHLSYVESLMNRVSAFMSEG